MKKLRFLTDVPPRPSGTKFLDALAILSNYCQVNFTVPVEKLKNLIHPRFEPLTVSLPNLEGNQAIISAVVFEEKEFHFLKLPFLGKYSFGQADYRCYCIDKETGVRTVWLFGTTLDHWSRFIPRYIPFTR